MANVLLFYPTMRLVGYRFPYSILPLAGYLLKNKHQVKILDAQVEDYKDLDINQFDLIGISTLTGPQIKTALEFAKYCRTINPDIPLVWGGVHTSLTPDQTILDEHVDIVCRGEGEETMVELAECIISKSPLDHVKGIIFKDHNGNIIRTPDRPFIDLNESPMPPYHLLKVDKYSELNRKPRLIYMETSRGCPHRCGFCYDVAVHKRRWRAKDPIRVVDEMEFLFNQYKVEEIYFTDDELAVDKVRLRQIAEEKLRRNLKVRWPIFSRANYIVKYDDEFLKLLKASGCDVISFGVETGTPRLLEYIKKDITLEQVKEAVRILDKNDISCGVSFMLGFPTETLEEMKQTLSFIDELLEIQPNLFVPQISAFTPLPGTDLFEAAKCLGFEPPRSLKEWGEYIYNTPANLTYLDNKSRALVTTIALLSKFDFTSKKYRGAGILAKKPVLKFIHKILWKIANTRWRYKYFSYSLEWKAVDAVLRLLKFGER